MTEVIVQNAQLPGEGPAEVTINNVQYWSRHTKELKGSQSSKARILLEHDCVQYIGFDPEFGSKYCFICLPLNSDSEYEVNGKIYHKKPYDFDYAKTVYKIYKNEAGEFCCNCQGWCSKHKRNEIPKGGAGCSHVLALFYAFKIKKFNQSHGATDKQMQPDLMEE